MKNDEIKVIGEDVKDRYGWLPPRWQVNMAREYAAAHSMSEISLDDFAATDEFRAQVRRNYGAADAVAAADVRANS